MKLILAAGATALLLLFGAAVPALAQDDHHDQEAKPEQKAQEAKPAQHEEQAKPAQHEEQPQAAKEEKQAKPEKQAEQAKPAQHEEQPQATKEEKQAKPQQQEQQAKSAKQDEQEQARGQQEQANANHKQGQHPQRTADEQRTQREQPALRLSARSESRIPDDRFRSNFGRNHEFRIGSPQIVDGYSRFQYGGYWFGFVQPWPNGWYYSDDVYVDYIDGAYYLCNPYYPGTRVSIIVVL
jgi:outer membrane biosynthesis protein TonB